MSDIKLFRIADSGVTELQGRSLALERSLQTLMERNLETLLGVRFLASEYSTGIKHKGRIDTLGIDENGCPVIIEYKRATNENIINQGLFYLDWLMDHQAEFKLLVLERYGKETAEAIEWSSPRLLCIARDFTRYDEHAVQQINRNIELIRYRHFPDGFLILEMVNAVHATQSDDAKGIDIRVDVAFHLEKASDKLKDVYYALEDYIMCLDENIQKRVLKSYISFNHLRNFAKVEVRGAKAQVILLYVKCPPSSGNYIEGLTRWLGSIGKFNDDDLELSIKTMDDFERSKPFIEQSYQRS